MLSNEVKNFINEKKSLGIKPGLLRIEKALEFVDKPQDKIKVIHICGTNGKGTTAYNIYKNLIDNGLIVGLFTSPWISEYNEQIQINNKNIFDYELEKYINIFKEFDLTEFELITAIMYKYFYDNKVDYAVVECGLGGLDDATNVVSNPKVCVVTSISLDHTNLLGSTITDIASNKSGIINNNSKVFLYPNTVEINNVFISKSIKHDCKYLISKDVGNYIDNDIELAKLIICNLGYKFINNYYLPYRVEYIRDDLIVDGSHNVDGIEPLLKELIGKEKVNLMISMLKDKDVKGYLIKLLPFVDNIIITTIDSDRAINPNDLKNIINEIVNLNVEIIEDPHDAYLNLIEKDGLKLITGSFYLLRSVSKLIKERKEKN